MNNKEKVKIILLFVLLAIVIPILIDLLMFGNAIPSNIDNESWASFLGAIIGGGCTCWAVIMQKQYTDEQRKIDEIVGMRPYIVAERPTPCQCGGVLELDFYIQNVGSNSACDIEIYAVNGDWEKYKKLTKGNIV